MKTKIKLSFLTFGLMILSTFCCKSNHPNYSHEQILSMLHTFYKSYITENAKMPTNLATINFLKEKYCTTKLLQRIEEEEFDYDPFLKAQDCSIEWLKTLSIREDTIENNLFYVSYTDTYSGSQTTIKLVVVKEKETFKIDSIL